MISIWRTKDFTVRKWRHCGATKKRCASSMRGWSEPSTRHGSPRTERGWLKSAPVWNALAMPSNVSSGPRITQEELKNVPAKRSNEPSRRPRAPGGPRIERVKTRRGRGAPRRSNKLKNATKCAGRCFFVLCLLLCYLYPLW